MPIYRYNCNRCNIEIEVNHSMADLNLPQYHQCGTAMKRLVANFNISCPLNTKNRVMNTLNDELPLPTRQHDKPRMKKALARGLERDKRVIGVGF